MGIDVGGTYTKCVAMDNETHEIIGKNQVKTTHDDKSGVAAGVVKSFQNCMRENNIAPEDVVFVAHSTTQATNAFIEGDVASVGVVGVAGGGLEGFLAKRQLALKDIVLDEKVGRMIKVYNTFIKKKMLTEDVINQNIDELLNQGSQVIVASMAFGVDSMDEEMMIHNCAEKKNVPVTMASDITKLYGLTRRTRTAAINASILPKMMMTANATESSVRAAGVTVPLMIMRGDGGVMEISEMRKRPILTALSGPAASVKVPLCTCVLPTPSILRWAVPPPTSALSRMAVRALTMPRSADMTPISVPWMCVSWAAQADPWCVSTTRRLWT